MGYDWFIPPQLHDDSDETKEQFEEIDGRLGRLFMKSLGSPERLLSVKDDVMAVYNEMREIATLPSDIAGAPSVYDVLGDEVLKEKYLEKIRLWSGKSDPSDNDFALGLLKNSGVRFVYCLSDLEDQGVQFRFWGLRCRLSVDCIYYHLDENGLCDLAKRCFPSNFTEKTISPEEGLVLADDLEAVLDQIPDDKDGGNEVNGYLVIKSAITWLRYWGEKGIGTHLG
jgi:hypothetical protein